jgi:hypothetical protein
VYDLRNYNDQNYWGPYLDDGSLNVDWEKVEAIMIDLGYNLQKFTDGLENAKAGDVDVYNRPFEGITPYSYTPIQEYVCPGVKALVASGTWNSLDKQVKCLTGQPEIPLDAMDPYGVSGTWRRVSGPKRLPLTQRIDDRAPDRVLPRLQRSIRIQLPKLRSTE